MEKVIVKVVEEKTSTKKRPYLLVDLADKRRMSCWDTALFPKVLNAMNAATEVDIEFEVKGDYTTITAIGSQPIEVNPSLDNPREPISGLDMTHKDRMIIAQCLTKCFCSCAPVDMSKEDVLETFHWYRSKL